MVRIYFLLEFVQCVFYITIGLMAIIVGCSIRSYLKAKTDRIRKGLKDGDGSTDH